MKAKVVVLSGSIRFWDTIQEMHEKLELEHNHVVIGITPHVMNRDFTAEEEDLLDELHHRKIDLADALYVVNVGGYIGRVRSKKLIMQLSLAKRLCISRIQPRPLR